MVVVPGVPAGRLGLECRVPGRDALQVNGAYRIPIGVIHFVYRISRDETILSAESWNSKWFRPRRG